MTPNHRHPAREFPRKEEDMAGFDLRQHVRAVLASTPDEDLDELVFLVFKSTPKSAVSTAYHQALIEVVRREVATAPRPTGSAKTTVTADRGQVEHGNHEHLATVSGGGNVDNSRVALLRRNRFRITVWVGDKTYRHILECTRENLEFAAIESDRQAEANAATARRYRRLVKKMVERGVDKVSELSDADIEGALNDE